MSLSSFQVGHRLVFCGFVFGVVFPPLRFLFPLAFLLQTIHSPTPVLEHPAQWLAKCRTETLLWGSGFNLLPIRKGWKCLNFQSLAVLVGLMEGMQEGSSLFLCAFNSEDFGDVTFWVWLLLFLLLSHCNAVKVILSKREGSC